MWAFWIFAGGLAAAAALLVAARAAAASRAASAAGEDPALPIYRRQLAELDELANRGLLGPEERQAARAEAARRLLSASERARPRERPGGRGARLAILAGVAGAAMTALALYLVIGSPGMPDEPYRARVRAWRDADPATLGAPQMAAVLRDIARQRPHDPQVYDYLGRAELASGDPFAAATAFQSAAHLAPGRADLRAAIGEAAMAEAEGGGEDAAPAPMPPQARAAFLQALAIDPRNAPSLYYLGRADIAGGDAAGGLALWRALASTLAAADPRRPAILAEIDHVAHGGGLQPSTPSQPPAQAGGISQTATSQTATSQAAAPQATPPPGQLAFIRAMVARQAAELKAHPDDPDGWARLVRSYGVIGDKAAEAQALAQARQVFATRPDVLARIEAEAKANAGPAPPPGG